MFRMLPTIDEPSAFFWTSGEDGRLRFLRCPACAYLIHPPAPLCPVCHDRRVAPAPVSGRGILYSYTVNHQPWDSDTEPYVIAIVELDEQPGLRLTTNLVGLEPEEFDSIEIGMPVEVCFEDHDPVFVPLFRPATP